MRNIFTLLLLFISSFSYAHKYYVSTSGNNSNDGLTTASPWQTLEYAESHAISVDDTICLKKGDKFITTAALGISHGGTSGHPIVWDGGLWGTGANAIIYPDFDGSNTTYYSAVNIRACSYLTFKNITVDVDNHNLFGIVVGGGDEFSAAPEQNSETNIIVQGCKVLDCGRDSYYSIGILIRTWNTDMSNITIQGNQVDGVQNHGIAWYNGREAYGATPSVTRDSYCGYNIITNCGFKGDGVASNILVTEMITNLVVEHNIITQGTNGLAPGIATGGSDGFPQGVIIRYNDIRMIDRAAIYIGEGGTQTADIYYNLLYLSAASIHNPVIHITKGTVPYTNSNFNIWNNTLVSDYNTCYDDQSLIAGTVKFKNNILLNNGTGPSCVVIGMSGSTLHSNNSYYRTGVGDLPYIIDGKGFYKSDVLAWEPTAIVADPLLADIQGFNWHLQTGSLAIDAGIVIPGLTKDFEGVSLGNPPNIGCFETPAGLVEPVYNNSVIENTTPSRLEMNYSLPLANIIPATSAFAVTINSTARTVSFVVISGTKVLLTLGSPVASGSVVTVAYTKPSSNPLQTTAGGQAATISAQTVTNKVAAPAEPVFSGAVIENTTPSRVEMTYSLSLASILPAASAFDVKVNSVARTVSSVSISGTKVLLTLASPVAYGNTVTVAYTKPFANPLQTSAGGLAATISAQTVTNKIAAPSVPVYVSSAIENATPSKLEMIYSLSLANFVPAVSAFIVMVNSTTRTVSSVAISGSKVILSLASPVAAGNVVTVSYSRPSVNPLQTSAGGLAATIKTQSVTNKVQAVNALPVIVVKSTSSYLSGFVGELDATGSYDPNKDKLTYSWIPPANISVSSTTSSKIQFLGPIVVTPKKFDITLHISDGKATQSKVIPVAILPYKPELEVAEILNVEASSFNSPNNPQNVLDGNPGTMWAANGDNQWLILELKEPFNIQHIRLGFKPGQKGESYFDILGSEDILTWDPILLKSASCNFSGDIQVFEFPASKAEKEYKYVKLIGQSNSTDTWNYISEFKIFGYKRRNPISYEELPVKLYPNPALDYVTIRIEDPTLVPDVLKIINLSGTIVYQSEVNPDIREFRIPINFNKGMYVIQLQSNDLVLFAQKLIVL